MTTPSQVASIIHDALVASLMQVPGAHIPVQALHAAANNAAQALEIDPLALLVDIAGSLGARSVTIGQSSIQIHVDSDNEVIDMVARLDMPVPHLTRSLDQRREYLTSECERRAPMMGGRMLGVYGPVHDVCSCARKAG